MSNIYMDQEFECLRDLLKNDPVTCGATLNCSSANEHVPEIERRIRVIKERARA